MAKPARDARLPSRWFCSITLCASLALGCTSSSDEGFRAAGEGGAAAAAGGLAGSAGGHGGSAGAHAGGAAMAAGAAAGVADAVAEGGANQDAAGPYGDSADRDSTERDSGSDGQGGICAGAVDAGSDASIERRESGAPLSEGGTDALADAQPEAADAGAVASFATMWSATAVATPSQQLMTATGTNTYRSYMRPLAAGKYRWAFWFSNGVDSTYGAGAPSPNKMGGSWRIEAAYIADGGAIHAGAVVPGTQKRVTFAGSSSKIVQPGERFWSDPVELDLPAGHDLAFSWSLSGSGYPFVSSTFLTAYRANANVAESESATGFTATNDPLVTPQLIAYDRPVDNRLCFLGDSITQGAATGGNTYGYWVAKIAAGFGPNVSVWNLGSGWARAADAASDGYWLYKAKQCSEVAVILGVNDLGNSGRTAAQVLADLATIVDKLKKNQPAAKVILFTVPTFDFTGTTYDNWKQVNTAILSAPPTGTDRVFDIAAVLSQPAPNDGQVKSEYRSGDAHPNDLAGTAIANAFLSWYKK
jgi:lysophospholipase L1-like esterase